MKYKVTLCVHLEAKTKAEAKQKFFEMVIEDNTRLYVDITEDDKE